MGGIFEAIANASFGSASSLKVAIEAPKESTTPAEDATEFSSRDVTEEVKEDTFTKVDDGKEEKVVVYNSAAKLEE